MKVKVHFYIVKLICSVILFVLILSALHFIVRQGSQLFEFFFARSFVQYVTIYIFAFTVILLGSRTIFFLRNTQQFNAARKGKRILSDQTKTVNEVLMKSGAEAAISFVNHMIKEEKNKISKSYEIINFLLCSLPACGLFGTMLGLSNSLFTAFSAGVGREKGIQQFVTALSTALDTTVLAMACAMFLGGFAWNMDLLSSMPGLFARLSLLTS
jgi:biopolymer transport protein ExbB/TolQ